MTVSPAFLDRFHALDAVPGKYAGSPPSKKLSMLLRPAFIAAPQRTLVWGDWSAIEARVLPWLAASPGGDAVLDVFRTNDADPKLPDIYIMTAAALLGRDAVELWQEYLAEEKSAKDARQAYGKVPTLSLGFGGGLGALTAMATNYGVYLDTATALRVVEDWRATNAWAKAFWGKHGREGSYGLWGAANSAIENPDTPYVAGRVAYVYDRSYLGGTLFCALPCGRLLTYPGIKWEWREIEDKKTKKLVDRYQLTFLKGYGRTAAWYGKLCLGADTLVATDAGWKRIVYVADDDLLWDGVEWVRHGGLLKQGYKFTVPLDGVDMTPDHKVLTVEGWQDAWKCHGLDRAPVRLPDSLAERPDAWPREARAVGVPLQVRGRDHNWFGRLAALKSAALARVLRLRDGIAHGGEEAHARYGVSPGLRGVAFDGGSLPAADAPGVEKLRWARHKSVRALDALLRFLGGYGADLRPRTDTGAHGQQQGLRAGKLYLGDLQGPGPQQTLQPAAEHAGAVGADGRAALHAALSLAPEPVYDLADAGPRSRFVVLGASGPFIVHNCENITQATAASVLRRTLKRLDKGWHQNDDRSWRRYSDFIPVVMHTHDEIVTEPFEGYEKEARGALLGVMEKNDEWDEGLPLKAEISSFWAYTKAKV